MNKQDTKEIAPFGSECFDHISTETMLKIVNTGKIYDLQDIAEAVWFKNKCPSNRNINIRLNVCIWNGEKWKIRDKEEVAFRMIETISEKFAERLIDKISDDQMKWLKSIPKKKGRDFTYLMKSITRLLDRNEFISPV